MRQRPLSRLRERVPERPAVARYASYGGFQSAEAREREGGSESGRGAVGRKNALSRFAGEGKQGKPARQMR